MSILYSLLKKILWKIFFSMILYILLKFFWYMLGVFSSISFVQDKKFILKVFFKKPLHPLCTLSVRPKRTTDASKAIFIEKTNVDFLVFHFEQFNILPYGLCWGSDYTLAKTLFLFKYLVWF